MFIYIDESGSFTPTSSMDSWNIVGALVVPEASRRQLEAVLRQLKLSLGCKHTEEVKLKHLHEQDFRRFVKIIGELDCLLFVTAVDLGAQAEAQVRRHQQDQVDRIQANRPLMNYPEGREIIDDLSGRMARLSVPLYIQFVAQVDLLEQVFRSTTLYYAQRVPATLAIFRWRIDEKNAVRPSFEETMKYMAPPACPDETMAPPAGTKRA